MKQSSFLPQRKILGSYFFLFLLSSVGAQEVPNDSNEEIDVPISTLNITNSDQVGQNATLNTTETRPKCKQILKKLLWRKCQWGKLSTIFSLIHTVRNLHFLSKNSTLLYRENGRFFFGWNTREYVLSLDFLPVDNFDFTRKIVKKIWMKNSWKLNFWNF